MQEHEYNVTNIQVENKFKSLERSYKNMKCNNKQTGRSRATCLYETEVTELLGHKHNIEPLAVSESEGVIIREDMRASTSQCDTSETMSMDSINTDISVNLSDDINKQHDFPAA